MKAFDVHSYVENRLIEECINNEDSKESFRKQVTNILKYFDFINDIDLFENIRAKKDKQAKHIFACFPFWSLADADKKRFLDFIFDKKREDSSKFVANINKIHIDSKTNLKGDIGKKRDFKEELCISETISQYISQCQYTQYKNRTIIREGQLLSNEINSGIRQTIELLTSEKLYFNLSLAADLVSDCCLQILNYWVISIIGLSEKQIEFILESFKNYIESFNNNTVLWHKTDKEIKYKDAVGIYAAFLERRNYYGQYLDIIRVLEQEANSKSFHFSDPPKEYRVTKNMGIPQNFKNILTEGQCIDNFKKKLENTKNLIDVFSKYGYRNASIDKIMDLKVYFREFYLSNSKYKNQAQTIVRKYIVKCKENNYVDSFDKISEYQFLREKLNRGYFRETIGLASYHKKNEIQEIIYTNLLFIFLTYHYDTIMEQLIRFIEGFIDTYRSCIKTMIGGFF